MLLRLCIPLIALILLRNLGVLEENADLLLHNFEEDYQALVCARADVYRRNMVDALHFLSAQYPYLTEAAQNEEMDEDGLEECQGASFSVYRETNPKLPWIYPNWLYRETAR